MRRLQCPSCGARTHPPPQYYDLPSLSMREAAWHLMRAGVDGFKVGV